MSDTKTHDLMKINGNERMARHILELMESEDGNTVRANIIACMGGVRPFFLLQNLLRYLNKT